MLLYGTATARLAFASLRKGGRMVQVGLFGGEITLQSQIEQGTTMQLNLPRDLRAILATQTGAA